MNNDICEWCRSELIDGYPINDGCPLCKECGGQYSGGSEECDFCEYSDECASEYNKRFAKK